MKHEGRPAEEWLEILTTANAAQIRAKYGIADAPQLLADLLTDLGMVPKHDELVQVYRSMGKRNEAEFWGDFQRCLPGMQSAKTENSISTLAEKTGFAPRSLIRRRSRLTFRLAAQDEIWGQK
jgi:hypothetical protein